MNYAIVFRLLGYILMIEGALLLLPAAASLIYGEWMVLAVFLLTAAVSAGIGFALRAIMPRSKVFYMREGFTATALSWIVISVVGAAPFVLTGCIPNPVDALFETVSGFTTTGASILPEVESLPKGILFWRSFTHWIGGMGVLVFLLSLLPLTGGSHVNLMKAESPGPQVDKLVPKVQSTAKILYGIYLALTVLELVFLLAWWDAVLWFEAIGFRNVLWLFPLAGVQQLLQGLSDQALLTVGAIVGADLQHGGHGLELVLQDDHVLALKADNRVDLGAAIVELLQHGVRNGAAHAATHYADLLLALGLSGLTERTDEILQAVTLLLVAELFRGGAHGLNNDGNSALFPVIGHGW